MRIGTALNSRAAAQGSTAPKPNPQTAIHNPQSSYLLRVTNTLYGPVEISLDDGAHWELVGRVEKPAIDRAPGGSGSLPVVERSSSDGMAFGVGQGKLVRVLPDYAGNLRNPTAIVVNLPSTATLFKDLLPGSGSPVQQSIKGKPLPLPSDYMPQDGDQFLITAQKGSIGDAMFAGLVKEAEDRYREDTLARLHAKGKSPTSGVLTLNAAPPSGDPLNAVTFVLDGNVLAIQNRPPFTLRLNTRDWPNGEHLIEVRGLNSAGSAITQVKRLVVVENGK